MAEVLSLFEFNLTETVGLSIFFLLFIIQLFFYFKYYRRPYSQAKKNPRNEGRPVQFMQKVSVIIVSENEADCLSQNLPAILEQDYFDYEVIVVNNGSTDESDISLRSLELQYPNLYHTFLPYSNDRKMDRRKLALTIGVKAAKGDILLFTEPYCKPVSSKWISTMVNTLSPEKDIVFGYSYFGECKKFFNRVARFDNLLFSMQSISSVLNNRPYTGNYRNLLFRKQLFFAHKGYASLLNTESGEDLFISQISSYTNTTVSLDQDSFMEANLEDFSLWRQIKRSFFLIRPYLNKAISMLFGFEVFTRSIFYLLFVALVVYSIMHSQWVVLGLSAFFFLLRLIIQLVVLNKSSQYFHSGKFYFSLLLLDILQPLYNIRFKGLRF